MTNILVSLCLLIVSSLLLYKTRNMTKATNTHESQGGSNGRGSNNIKSKIMPKRLSLRRKSMPDDTTTEAAAASKSSSGMFSKLRPLTRGGGGTTTTQRRARTTGTTIGAKDLAEKQIGSIEFLQNKGLDSSDFKPRQEHPLMAASRRGSDGMDDVSGKTETSSETTST